MAADQVLKSYARVSLMRAAPPVDAREVDAFIGSDEFGTLASAFDINLASHMSAFKASRSMPAPAAPARPPVLAPPAICFGLRPARAGEAYVQVLAPQPPAPDAVVYSAIALPGSLGMLADTRTGVISGTPAAAGEYDIALEYRLAGEPAGDARRAVVKLIVNADPKTLWKDLPSDRQAPYWKADQACSSIAAAGFRLLAASKRGRSHAHVGGFRDDDYRIASLAQSGWQLAVVSDGAGSARYSRRGSQLICEQAVDQLRLALEGGQGSAIDRAARALGAARLQDADSAALETLDEVLHEMLSATIGRAASVAFEAIEVAAGESGAAVSDFSSTALIGACKRYPFGTLFAAYWVGDGAVGLYSAGTGITLLGEADSGEYAGQTRFLDASAVVPGALRLRTRCALVDGATALVLMTDGVSDPKFETPAGLARAGAWDQLWQELDGALGMSQGAPNQVQKLLAWLDFWSPGNHDDRTIAIICQG